jgi:hypothetical protein
VRHSSYGGLSRRRIRHVRNAFGIAVHVVSGQMRLSSLLRLIAIIASSLTIDNTADWLVCSAPRRIMCITSGVIAQSDIHPLRMCRMKRRKITDALSRAREERLRWLIEHRSSEFCSFLSCWACQRAKRSTRRQRQTRGITFHRPEPMSLKIASIEPTALRCSPIRAVGNRPSLRAPAASSAIRRPARSAVHLKRVGWVERRNTHHFHCANVATLLGDLLGRWVRCVQPILQVCTPHPNSIFKESCV